MKQKYLLFATIVMAACSAQAPQARADFTIAANGKSTFIITIPAAAPTSVQSAAAELQKDIQIATGVKLPIQKGDAKVTTPLLSLGNTAQAKAAGISSANLTNEAFRIVTKNGNLYILGIDTPRGEWTKNNGTSNGTANGVYSFLEDYLNVRWLMPGDIGRDVPTISTFTIGNIDRTVTPKFSWRRVTHLWDYSNLEQFRSIQQWDDHQKLGGATNLDYGANWWRAINDNKGNSVNTPAVKALYKEHPDWFAMNAYGKRPYPTNYHAKMETTNQQFVKWFAEKAIATLKASDRPRTFSLSPSDGSGWSQSPESKALYDPNPSKLFDPETPTDTPSMSSLVLTWYHDVAQIVAKEYPQGRLAGYIYSSYVYPPDKVSMKLPGNFTPVICGIGTYGYQLYRQDNQKRWKWVMDSWAKVAPKTWFYYDLPNQKLRQYTPEIGKVNFPGSTGIITPAAPDILNTIFPELLKSHIKGTYIYGVPSWSNAAMANYMLAKMEWDPTLNADDVQREWLQRAYGANAGKVMGQFYTELNGWYRDYYQAGKGKSYRVTLAILRDLYAAHYPEMEKLLLQAKAQKMTPAQEQRFALLENNLIVLQWRLRNAGFLSASFASPLRRTDAQINTLLTADNPAFPNFPGAVSPEVAGWNKAEPLPYKVQFSKEVKAGTPISTFKGLDDSEFLLYAAKDGDIRITPKMVTSGAYFPSYTIKNVTGQTVNSGILDTATPIIISAKAGDVYILNIPSRKAVNYQLQVENAAMADASFQDGTLTLYGKTAPVYVFYMPQSEPIGVVEDNNSVAIKKPFSGAAALALFHKSPSYTDPKVLASLDEGWRFAPDPNNDALKRGVTKSGFDDSSWDTINALNWWQFQGFPDYQGTAWYRIKFDLDKLPSKERSVRLYFGAVDGDAVVYLNGKKVTEHKVGSAPDFKGWDKPFTTYVRHDIKQGENILAIKVTSKPVGSSGIIKGVSLLSLGRVEK